MYLFTVLLFMIAYYYLLYIRTFKKISLQSMALSIVEPEETDGHAQLIQWRRLNERYSGRILKSSDASLLVFNVDLAKKLLSSKHALDKGPMSKYFAPWLGNESIFVSNGTQWKETRRTIFGGIRSKESRAMQWSVFWAEARAAVSELATTNGQVDIRQNIVKYVHRGMIKCIYGQVNESFNVALYEQLLAEVTDILLWRMNHKEVREDEAFYSSELGLKFVQCVAQLRSLCPQPPSDFAADSSRDTPSNPNLFISRMRKSNCPGQSIQRHADALLFAGHDTLTNALLFLILHYSNSPPLFGNLNIPNDEYVTLDGAEAILNDEIWDSLCGNAVITDQSRTVTEDFSVESEGNTILVEKGTVFTIPIFALKHLPFSCGPRDCLGRKTAQLALKALLLRLLQAFRSWQCTPQTVTYQPGMVLKPAETILCTFEVK